MQGNFHFVFKGPKYLIPFALKLRMIVVLLCSVLNLSNFSWYKHTFSPFSFFVFALARSALSFFVLFNDYYSMF